MSDIQKIEVQEVSENITSVFSRFGLDLPLSPNDVENLNQLKIYLAEKLKDLLDNNFSLLVNTLYRIDVSEEKLNELFGSKNRVSIPSTLADLIIERQLQKIHFRKKYKEGNL
jgi:plasmid maintenance system killer protein